LTRFPTLARPGLGVGMDLPWGDTFGFTRDPVRGDGPTPRTRAFLEKAQGWTHFFASWQPRNRSRLDAQEYFEAFDAVFDLLDPSCIRALHQTTFNLGGAGHYDRAAVVDFTNQLIARYGIAWVNEDLGIWSLAGRQMPYPLPPYPTDAGLECAIANTRFVQERLAAPLLVEFPGFAEDTRIVEGPWHAYDFFRELIEQSDTAATLDTGHLLSYQWLLGKRGDALFDDLDRLPLKACFEIHLSGCQIVGDRFIDAHHGVLLDEQLRMLSVLLERCPNVRAITYEDPRFDAQGALIPKARPSWERLQSTVAQWTPQASQETPSIPKIEARNTLQSAETALTRALHDSNVGDLLQEDCESAIGKARPSALQALSKKIVHGLLRHAHAGCGSLQKCYPETLAHWRSLHPEDPDLALLAASFAASDPCAQHVELAAGAPGICIEEAFFLFCTQAGIGEPEVLEEEFLSTMMRVLGTSPRPAFAIPSAIKKDSNGLIAISSQRVVHALSQGRIIRGRLPAVSGS
jgi:uncharacterized protein (UPF0276 family)